MNQNKSKFIGKPPKGWAQAIMAFAVMALLLTSCAQATAQATPSPQPPPQPTVTTSNEAAASAITAAKAALAKKLSINADTIQLVDVQSVHWPDSCLGVSQPGIMCAQHVVDGYRMTLSAKDQTYEAHSNLDGSQIVLVPGSFPTSSNLDAPAQAVADFLNTLKADPSGQSSLIYLSNSLRADINNGSSLPSLLGIQDTYSSFGISQSQPVPGTEQVLVDVGLNYVSPIQRSFVLSEENNIWHIDTIIVYAIPSLISTSNYNGADQVILEYVQALQSKDAATAWDLLASGEQTNLSQTDLERQARGLKAVSPVAITLNTVGQDQMTFTVELWVNLGQNPTAGWHEGRNTRTFTLSLTVEGWRISQIQSVS